MPGNFNPVEFEGVTVKKETAGALLCVIDGDEHWIPKSQIMDESEVFKAGTEGKLVIPEWLATEKGLV